MEPTFRASMNWLHTWAGVVLGGVLFAIFWMGTLSVFDREIDRSMAPMTRLEVPRTAVSLDSLRSFHEAAVAAKSPSWFVAVPTEREPWYRVGWREPSGFVSRMAHPETGAQLPDPGTLAGSRFFYPFHYMLQIRIGELGYWIVGLAAMAMMALCVSGVIVHRKIFTDFFTLRAATKPHRLILDLHNVTGVLGLPFHFVIALSGLIIFWSTYFPGPLEIAYRGDRRAFNEAAFGSFNRPKLNQPGELVSLDLLAGKARALWNGEGPRFVSVRNPGDAAAYVQVFRANEDSVGGPGDMAVFDASTGELLSRRTASLPVMSAKRFISGLHLIQFRHWTLRWLYFGLGLTGCVLIGTGYLFWLESRRKKHLQLGLRGVRVVEGLAQGAVTGIVIATLSFFIVNRLLPLEAAWLGQDRAALEVWTFYLVWLATFGHAWLQAYRAWRQHCWTIAGLAVAAMLLNWITTGDHLPRSLAHRHLWPIAGIDLVMLAGAGAAAAVALRLGTAAPARIALVQQASRMASRRGLS